MDFVSHNFGFLCHNYFLFPNHALAKHDFFFLCGGSALPYISILSWNWRGDVRHNVLAAHFHKIKWGWVLPSSKNVYILSVVVYQNVLCQVWNQCEIKREVQHRCLSLHEKSSLNAQLNISFCVPQKSYGFGTMWVSSE